MTTTIYYIASILSIFLFVISVQFAKKKDILLVQIFASMCYCVVYYIKGALTGCYIEFVEQAKDVVFYRIEKKGKTIPFWCLVLFVGLLVGISIVYYDGILSLLPLIINILYFVSSYFKNPRNMRLIMLINAILWIGYNFYTKSYIIIIGNILEIISAIISLIRFKDEDDKVAKKGKKKGTKRSKK